MNKNLFIAYILISLVLSNNPLYPQHKFYVNLNERSEDLFNVTLYPENLSDENKVYNFAATAPGTYQIMNIGRYVRSFQAFDKDGNEIQADNVSQNRWLISQPEKVDKIVYTIAETWDTQVDENQIYLMAGSSIEDDNVLMNNQCVFGYFDGMQDYKINIKLDYPDDWKIGTALQKNSEGYYEAEDYDYLVDSPILLGDLSEASINISGTNIEVYTYSKSDLIKSQDLLDAVEDIIYAADKFTEGLPVERYAFLFHFEDQAAGAWEHSYSSIYIYPEFPLSGNYVKSIKSTVAHEFFHIVTPLNIHSELITNFNFAEPKLSQHTWLYESVTEWASDAMQLRGDIYSLDEYLNELTTKLNQSDNFRKDISLTELAVNSFELQNQFYIFYCRGAVIMTLLDIKLLEESKGKKGLREVINELAEDYGPQKSFSEENFFKDFSDRTFPSIMEFFKKYVQGNEPLPLKEYFEKVGINYLETAGYDSSKAGFDFGFAFREGKLSIGALYNDSLPVKTGDVFYKFNGQEITSGNMQQIFSGLTNSKPGELVHFVMKRDSVEINFDYKLPPAKINHLFEVNENPNEQQTQLRKAWMQNL